MQIKKDPSVRVAAMQTVHTEVCGLFRVMGPAFLERQKRQLLNFKMLFCIAVGTAD